jgi:NodT family efflux transporter outer membrane factor (OMF) lipoprotein
MPLGRLTLLMVFLLPAFGCGLSQWARNGLKVGPNYHGTPAAVAEHWIENDDQQVRSDLPVYPKWWSVLNDPVLDGLVADAYRQNLTLREAAWRVTRSRAQMAIAVGNFFPQTQEAFGSYDHIQVSRNQASPFPFRAFDEWSTGFNATWELDVWGLFRRAIASADAEFEASVANYDGVLVSLIAEVATAYVGVRTFQLRLKYAANNVRIQEQSLELTRTRARLGKTPDVGVHLAESDLESTRALVPELEIGLRQSSNRLCTLLGIPTVDLLGKLGDEFGIPQAPSELAVGIPADLLRRRPDVRRAERDVAAQSEQIGIAKADLYPIFTIRGDIGVASEKFSSMFSPGSTTGMVGPSFRWKLLNYGRIVNNVRLQEAGFQQLIASYQNSVLTANQEVEDSLVAYLQRQQRVERLAATVEATERALQLELIRFKEGESDFTGVFVLQNDLTQKQDQFAIGKGDVINSLIGVYRALGGGWQIRGSGSFGRDEDNLESDPEEVEPEEVGVENMEPVLPETPLLTPEALPEPILE